MPIQKIIFWHTRKSHLLDQILQVPQAPLQLSSQHHGYCCKHCRDVKLNIYNSMIRRVLTSRGGVCALAGTTTKKISRVLMSTLSQVEVHKFHSNPPVSTRLPNDASERNAIYGDERKRSMGGIEASVRHVSKIYSKDQDI